jgi:hypothetical protein
LIAESYAIASPDRNCRSIAGANRRCTSALQARFVDLDLIFEIADRNGDLSLTRDELNRWIDLQQAFVNGMVLVSVVDFGTGLFEFIDTSCNGYLSAAELHVAVQRRAALDQLPHDQLDSTKLPRHIRFILSRGLPNSLLDETSVQGPPWFVAQDRDGDGRITTTEFLGDLAALQQLDHNGDGVINVDEANLKYPRAGKP